MDLTRHIVCVKKIWCTLNYHNLFNFRSRNSLKHGMNRIYLRILNELDYFVVVKLTAFIMN